jgi:phosphatidylinositol-3-phosphatase
LTRISALRHLLLGGLLLAVTLAEVVAAVLLSRGGGGAVPSFSLPSFVGRPSAGPSASAGGSPNAIGPRRVWLIVMENRSSSQVIGDGDAPFINALAARYGLATDYHGVARPSQPNYLALISGSTQGVTDDEVHDLDAKTLLDQLDAAGHSWHVFAENVPPGCYQGATARNGPDGDGTYARKHEPAISFLPISRDPTRCSRITSLASFAPTAADFNLIIPNLCHDMHDCSTRAGDSWLAQFVPPLLASDAFRQGGLVVLTFDEASSRDESQHTVMVFAGPEVVPGTRATRRADHYGLLRTMQSIFGLDCLAQSCKATAIPQLLSPS